MELLVAAHIALGELGVFAFFWLIVELMHGPSDAGVLRAKGAALAGTALFFAAWLVGGVYYVVHYGSIIKPVIQQGTWPWTHSIFMETKEHIFLFLPFFSFATLAQVWQGAERLEKDSKLRGGLYVLAGVTALLGVLMTIMGYFVSSGFRHGLVL
ncbi:MAG: hypothetical protein A2Z21_10300 [Candidatus Fraserbacteria bacterium RBG_16_55_9]|uniref:DUF2231 domain-containing protein n=1 Tax=Fraserbacteria sp. (strain RBG_16_55_9) TaxID=1817864 RepID=A0A1F5V0X3_FRAXR|nr:MAG: hypothetical protein A2Z21_10300 [Candidatus Fraserbacteria bacterium RBG_16_55_9]